jgi:hypothetical protein
MTVGSLRSELLGISGIESAEIEGDVGAPSGVKVRLAPGADAAAVSEQVQRILAAHGLSSELSPEEGGAAPTSSAAPERFLVAAPEPEEGATDEEVTEVEEGPPPPAVIIEHRVSTAAAVRWLASIAVEEDREGVSVIATAEDGSSETRRARGDALGLDEAVVAAVGALVDPALPVPVLVAVDDRQVDGSTVLTLVIDVADYRMAGSTIVEGGRPYAVGRAAWAALSAR